MAWRKGTNRIVYQKYSRFIRKRPRPTAFGLGKSRRFLIICAVVPTAGFLEVNHIKT